MRRAEITANSTKVHNSLISKALGVEWKGMSDDEKAPYVQKVRLVLVIARQRKSDIPLNGIVV